MEEIWKTVEGFEEYQISNIGNVKSLKYGKEKILKARKDTNNYLYVSLCQQGKVKNYTIHRLVAMAFIENPNNYEEINHRDEDKANNCVSNLEWCDRKHNCNFGTRNQRVAASLSKQVLCVETNKIYPSVDQIKRQLGFVQSAISMCCTGKRKTAYGHTWKYV